MDLVDIFPAAIAVSKLESLTPDIIEKAIEMIELNSKFEDFAADGSYTREQQILDKVLFREVKDEILGKCLEFAHAYSHLVENIAICNSWGNIISQGQSIRFHKHVNSYISGSFYLTEGSSFSFHNFLGENLFSMTPELKANHNNYRSEQSFVINPKPGRLILFPSGLHHSVQPSKDTDKRYSIAFNTLPIGRVGSPTNLMDIRLS